MFHIFVHSPELCCLFTKIIFVIQLLLLYFYMYHLNLCYLLKFLLFSSFTFFFGRTFRPYYSVSTYCRFTWLLLFHKTLYNNYKIFLWFTNYLQVLELYSRFSVCPIFAELWWWKTYIIYFWIQNQLNFLWCLEFTSSTIGKFMLKKKALVINQ